MEKPTTLKLQKETKIRLEKLRENQRETYDDIIRKILFILSTTREDPEKAKRILERIDEIRKRMFELKQQEIDEKKQNPVVAQKTQKILKKLKPTIQKQPSNQTQASHTIIKRTR